MTKQYQIISDFVTFVMIKEELLLCSFTSDVE